MWSLDRRREPVPAAIERQCGESRQRGEAPKDGSSDFRGLERVKGIGRYADCSSQATSRAPKRPGFDDRNWRRVTVPHDWSIMDKAELGPSTGYCNTMGTATTMNSLAEALGMSLPGSAAISAPYRDRRSRPLHCRIAGTLKQAEPQRDFLKRSHARVA